jgi:4-amino-4-deoxy-L-arabinose transferase-like glycosyltransferase
MSSPLFTSPVHKLQPQREKILLGGLLLAVIALAAGLRFYRLGEAGIGNPYYAAAVKSMLLSWKNFFFIAAEPGGSLSVDKPPLGFWVQTISAYFLGLTGFALALPNALAGVLSVFMTYQLVRRPFGPWLGLLAALALALTPTAIATERNNTIDGLLVFVLLLAAWAFLRAAESSQLRWLLLGAGLVGLGFNIKMLQAFLPLPAFFAVYFFGAQHSWAKKILHLAAATALLVSVSLAWAVAIDLTPASARPYVDSTQTNTVLELIIGHNGLERQGFGDVGGQLVPLIQSGGPDGSVDFGKAGTWRLFTAPLAGEASWLLPFVLGGLLLLVAALWKRPFSETHLALILWAGWLVPELVYFTYSTGLLHVYYLIMLGPPLAALTAMTAWAAWKIIQQNPALGWGLLGLLASLTLVFQGLTLWREVARAIWMLVLAALLCGGGFLLATLDRKRKRFTAAAFTLVLVSLFLAPGTWAALTAANPAPDGILPAAGPNQRPPVSTGNETEASQMLLDYLLANTQPDTYLLATGRISRASAYILETGRPVLALGGYVGKYAVVSVAQLAALVENGQLRFVLVEGLDQLPDLTKWIQQNCRVVETLGAASNKPRLYDCQK